MKTGFVFYLGLIFVIVTSGCRQPCYECTNNPRPHFTYDSVVSISYDSLQHRYDTMLVRIDTSVHQDVGRIIVLCPGMPGYQHVEGYGYTSGGVEYFCP